MPTSRSILGAAGASLTALVVALALAAAPASAGVLHFCGQWLSPGSYCDSSSMSSYITSIAASADSNGGIGVKVFWTGGNDSGYYYNSGTIVQCIPIVDGGFGRVRNTGNLDHYYTGTLYSWPDKAPGC